MKFIYLLSFLFYNIPVNAQDSLFVTMPGNVNKQPYVEVDGQVTSLNSLILDKEYITAVEVFKQDEAIARFGNKAKDGAILITTNKEVN
ncbi:MAG TPA: hypothetical protein VGD33_10850, partial [Chitinophagaceae bacterium]